MQFHLSTLNYHQITFSYIKLSLIRMEYHQMFPIIYSNFRSIASTVSNSFLIRLKLLVINYIRLEASLSHIFAERALRAPNSRRQMIAADNGNEDI